jgi:ribosomal protein S18 acetylase RimI-like enzyme
MNDLKIRLAGMQDLEALCRLYIEFHVRGVPDRLRSLGDPEKYDCSELYPKLEKIIKSDDSVIFLAEVDQKPVGLAEVYVREDKPDPARIQRKYGHLQSLIVTQKSRSQSIGKRLVGEAEKWAKQKGAKEIQLDIWEFKEGPLEFYERCGYRTLRRTLTREL